MEMGTCGENDEKEHKDIAVLPVHLGISLLRSIRLLR